MMEQVYLAVPLSLAAITIIVGGYAFYLKDIWLTEIQPNRYSWLIWSTTGTLEALTYDAVSGDHVKTAMFAASAVCCWGITFLILFKTVQKWPDKWEMGCLVLSAAAVIVWLIYREAFVAHLLMIVAIPVSFAPTWRSAYMKPGRESSPAWPMWVIADCIALSVVWLRLEGPEELPYIVVELICHLSVWLLVLWRSRVAPITEGGSS